MDIKRLINWKLYFILLTASIFSVVAVLPYALTLQGEILKTVDLPLPLLLLLSTIQSSVMFAVLIFVGLILTKTTGLGLPILENYIDKSSTDINLKSIFKISVLLGIITGIVIIILDSLFTKMGVDISEQVSFPLWQSFLASFYGGIGEEILVRLFVMTLIVWILSKLKRSKDKVTKNKLIIWISIIISSLLFGLGHLPATAMLTTLTPLVIFRALLLNGIGGVVFGWLYWKKGLESSMIAHFTTDITLHVLFPLLK